MRAARTAGWVLVAAVCLAGFLELAEDFAYAPKVMAFDHFWTEAAAALRSPWLTVVMMVVTVLGGTIGASVLTGAVAASAFYRGAAREALYAVAVVAVGATLSTFLKGVFERPRPDVTGSLIKLPDSFSFPSGHAMGSLCLAWAASYVLVTSGASRGRKAAGIAAAALYTLAVGFSRVYLGVHFPSDVLASWLLGAAWIAIATGAFLRLPDGEGIAPLASGD